MFDSMGSILEALSPEQQIACSTQNNILLTACPGSGKTRTLTHRLAYQVLRDPASKKIKIAITYTNRAAEEITNRLEGMNIDQSSIWAGTIHQFCMHFIIFLMTAGKIMVGSKSFLSTLYLIGKSRKTAKKRKAR